MANFVRQSRKPNQRGEFTMKAVLVFDLDEEREAFDACNKASETVLRLSDFEQALRNRAKHVELSEEAYAGLDHIRKLFFECMED